MADNDKALAQFWSRMDKTGACWIWQGARTPYGYGHLSFGGQSQYAHRLAYSIAVGPIPAGLQVLHRCDNPPCCNPDHLWLGTIRDNVADRDEKKRGGSNPRKGEAAHNAKLTIAKVKAIRERWASRQVTQTQLAKEYGLDPSTIGAVVNRINWKEVD